MTASTHEGLSQIAGDVGHRSVRRYRSLAHAFHWITAALVLLLVVFGVIMKQLGDGPVADVLFGLHKLIGALTLGVVALRLAYRLTGRDPSARQASYRRPVVHWTLYAVIILVPLFGWAGVSDFGARGIFLGYLLPAIWPEGAGYADALLEAHAYLAFGMLALVAVHIGNALQDYMMRARGAGPGAD